MIKMSLDAVIKLMTNRELYFKIRENALKLAQKYTPEEVFGKALLNVVSS
jgi:TfoX/Sxy family transcriptional regulator of competence genes